MQMFFGDLAENTDLAIKIEDIDSQTFSKMLKYIYTDEVQFETWESTLHVYSAAKYYMINSLKKYCVDYMAEKLEANDALTAYEFGIFHEETKVRDAALKLIKEKTRAVLKSPDFLKIDISTMSIILKQNKLEVSESDLFNALESLALAQNVIGNRQNDDSATAADATTDDNLKTSFEKFRQAVKQINFLDMTARQFWNGPAFSKLLLAEESLAIMACLAQPSNLMSRYPREFAQQRRKKRLPCIFFDISIDEQNVGNIVIQLQSNTVRKTFKKIFPLCIGKGEFGFKGGYFNNVKPGCQWYRAQAVQYTDGTPFNYLIDSENFIQKHSEAGTVGLCPANDKSYLSQIYITTSRAPNLDHRCVVIGNVIEGMELIKKFKVLATESGEPSKKILIENCGLVCRSVSEIRVNENL